MTLAPSFISGCAGVGGFDLALERVGFRCTGQIEIDPFCARVLERRFPGVERWGDIRSFSPRQQGAACWSDEQAHGDGDGRATGDNAAHGRTRAIGAVDLLVGGFPCQGASVAGKRLGLRDDRTALFWEFTRLADEGAFPWIFLENVPGLRSVGLGHDFSTVVAALAERGGAVCWRTLDSRFFGVPQRRSRVFFIVGPNSLRAESVLLEPEGSGGDSAAGGEAETRVAASLTSGSHGAGVSYPGRRNEDDVNLVISDPITGSAYADSAAQERKLVVANPLTTAAQRFEPSSDTLVVGALSGNKDRGGWRAGPDEAAAGHLIRTHAAPHAPHDTISPHRSGDGADLIGVVAHALSAEGADASEDGTGRGTPIVTVRTSGHCGSNGLGVYEHGDAPTVDCEGNIGVVASPLTTTYGKSLDHAGDRGSGPDNAVIDSGAVRRLTALECERLQGFPDGWTCLCGATEAILAERGIPESEWRLSDWRTIRLDEHVWRCTCPDGPRYKAMGNAVTVTTVFWIARRLYRAITGVAA